jgi:glucose dehydrogenase
LDLPKHALVATFDTSDLKRELSLSLGTGAPNIGGAVVTRSGLILIAATTDQYAYRLP